ncbi:leucine-rich repeat and guanylate kinase domain-containing protein-like isoform X1 [Oncorhynchus nerka]|uniref:leucine-rich repeat and guanylate kinase domain-containing protein-like isoform X1 n=1 Tax=Oncorhynchus nerka TaxID=8023 RepID=UPI0011324296|nr:leucine-rich repeat and guanylate kinase domain-containing protein-like isoform X1 [Oncorhynchus nerka]
MSSLICVCVFVHTVFIFPVFVMYHVLSIQRGNQIEKIENVETLRTLQVLDLSLNRISSLSGLQNLHLLGSINLESNLISEIKEATHIHDLCLLRELNLQRNLVQEQLDYRLAVIFLLQHLTGLDQEKVTVEEKAGWMYEMVISDGT